MSTISASVARQTLPAQLDRVEAGEEIAITRHGRVVAVLVHPDVLRARRATDAWNEADRVEAMLAASRGQPLQPPALSLERAQTLVASMRDDRARR